MYSVLHRNHKVLTAILSVHKLEQLKDSIINPGGLIHLAKKTLVNKQKQKQNKRKSSLLPI